MTTAAANQAQFDGIVADLKDAYSQLVKAGDDSVRAAWRFGQRLDSYSDQFTQKVIASLLGLSTTTIRKYTRLYNAYQRPELAQRASELLETYDVGILTELVNDLDRGPVEHSTNAGRRYRYRCSHCQSVDVKREEITDPDELAALQAKAEAN
jgi:predicted transcriptional regulator